MTEIKPGDLVYHTVETTRHGVVQRVARDVAVVAWDGVQDVHRLDTLRLVEPKPRKDD